MKSGFVAVIGKANAGKSTLVNVLVGEKVAIVSRRSKDSSFVGLLFDRYNNNKLLAVISSLVLLVFVGYYTASQFIGGGLDTVLYGAVEGVLSGTQYEAQLQLFALLSGSGGLFSRCAFLGGRFFCGGSGLCAGYHGKCHYENEHE